MRKLVRIALSTAVLLMSSILACAKRGPPVARAPVAEPPAASGEPTTKEAAAPSVQGVGIPPPGSNGRTVLRDGWHLVSSYKVKAPGGAIATAGYADGEWHVVRVPNTVLGALVEAGVYREPYKSDNLRRIPNGEFARSWWYRREFDLPAGGGERVWLGFDGINYRANIWLNGKLLASEKDVRGAFRTYRFDVTALAVREGKNALAVEVFRPEPNDLAINWWDWAFSPPDLNMGLFQDVYVRQTGPVLVEDLQLATKVPSPKRADATVTAVVTNATDQPREVTVAIDLADRSARRDVSLGARESKAVVFDPGTVEAFSIANPPLWWPVGFGRPELRTLSAKLTVAGSVSDQRTLRVGLREISSSSSGGSRLFSVNGRPIFLRGGGWSSDLLLRRDGARLDVELAYALHLGLNMIRLEGKLESDDFYDKADELGLVLLPGWMCCDVWEKQQSWNEGQRLVARESMRSQGARLAGHPSVAAFLVGSDKAPPPDVASAYAEALASVGWANPVVAAASAEGDSGLKMTGPYDWVPPNYWFEDKKNGGAFGFNSETGPGPAIAEVESLKTFMSARELDELWTRPGVPQFHAGAPGHKFQTLGIFHKALRARFGGLKSLEDWVAKAQLMNYEAERAAFEAYSVRKYAGTTGFVHWLLNSPWPSLIWHLYDGSLVPSAAFYGAKKANEPVHAVYAYDDRSIVVLNNTMKPEPALSVALRVLDSEGVERASERFPVNVGPDAVAKVGSVAEVPGLKGPRFVELELRRGPDVVSVNTYWLAERGDVLSATGTTFVNTPTAKYADLSRLPKLAPATVKVGIASAKIDGRTQLQATIENTGKGMAFFVRATLRRGAGGQAVTPVFWDDNYVTLRPGTKRTLTVTCPDAVLDGKAPVVDVEGVNVARVTAN